jgi:hypothetical protein
MLSQSSSCAAVKTADRLQCITEYMEDYQENTRQKVRRIFGPMRDEVTGE